MSRATRFIDACFGRPTDRTPVWLMRQAGRYQPSYRAIRAKVGFLELCRTPELAAQVTVNAVEELGVDAAIIFSDILVPLPPMGVAVEMTGRGPRIPEPLRDARAIEALRPLDPRADLGHVMEAIRLADRALGGAVPVIGFAGAPLTLAAYAVEGGHSPSFVALRSLLFGEPTLAHALFDRLADAVAAHLLAQVEAGARAVQLFDTWAGLLGPDDYRTYCLPYCQRIFDALAPTGVPRIIFGAATGALLSAMKETGADVVGVDWRVPLDRARLELGPETPVQGNLDPCHLFLPEAELEPRVADVLRRGGGRGHIFNLGHGVLPPTRPERARFVVEAVHRLSARERTPA